jgi:hypothetical protein
VPGVWPPVRWTSTRGATSYSFSNGRIWLWYSFKNRLPVRRSALSGQTPEAERRVNRHLFVPGCDLPRLNLVRLLVDTNRAPLSRRLQRR